MCVWSLLRIAPVSRCLCRSWETVSLFPWWVISFLSCEQATWVVVARAVGVILRIFFRDLRIWIPNTKNIPRISTALFWYIHRIRGNQKHAIFERNCLMQTVLKFVVFKPNSGVPPMWLRCEDPECQRQPTYGHKGDKRPRFCSTHKQPGMYDVIARRCEVPGCMTRAAFNFQGQKSVKYCAVHKEEGMENLKSKCCEVLCYFTAADDDDSFFCCAVCVSPSGIHQTCLGVGASRINFYVLWKWTPNVEKDSDAHGVVCFLWPRLASVCESTRLSAVRISLTNRKRTACSTSRSLCRGFPRNPPGVTILSASSIP